MLSWPQGEEFEFRYKVQRSFQLDNLEMVRIAGKPDTQINDKKEWIQMMLQLNWNILIDIQRVTIEATISTPVYLNYLDFVTFLHCH